MDNFSLIYSSPGQFKRSPLLNLTVSHPDVANWRIEQQLDCSSSEYVTKSQNLNIHKH